MSQTHHLEAGRDVRLIVWVFVSSAGPPGANCRARAGARLKVVRVDLGVQFAAGSPGLLR